MTTRRTAVNTDLNGYQQKVYETLCLKSFGYSSCWPDGNCGFNAVSQLLYSQDHVVDSICDLSAESQQQQGALRQAVAYMLRSDSVLQAILSQPEAHVDILNA